VPVSASGRVFWSLVILAMVALAGALPLAVRHRFEGVWIPSTSMAPTLLVGDYVLIDKAAHWPARGELVVFTDPSDPSELLVKRIVGSPRSTGAARSPSPTRTGATRRARPGTWPGSRSRPGPCS
jgi:signal peptidase I